MVSVLLPKCGRDFSRRINLDPMISDLRADFPATPAKHNEVRLLLRYMAINAIVRNRLAHLWMVLNLMTLHTVR